MVGGGTTSLFLRDHQMPFYPSLVTKSFTPTLSLISHWLILTIYIAY